MTEKQKYAIKLAISTMDKHIGRHYSTVYGNRRTGVTVGYGEAINILSDMVTDNDSKQTNADRIRNMSDDEWHNLKDQKPEDRQEVLTWDGLGVHEDRWSDDADYFESTDAKEIWWREMPEPPEV